MPESLTIPKSSSSFPKYLDWSLLREDGLSHIEELGSDLWTDYNLHDPGITILEVLCYALTDLGFRTNFDIKDLLTRSPEEKNLQSKTVFGLPTDDNFFSAAEILSCNPVTINDLRKLLIDIPGVRNAWLESAPDGEMAIYLNRKKKSLQLDLPVNGQEELDRIFLRGLYDICVEIEPQLVRDACGSVFFSKEGIISTVQETLNTHRNLCEDYRDIVIFGEEQIAICSDIELESSANPEDVLLEIYSQIEDFLSPPLKFYTLKELLQKGKRVEDIFEGRPLSAESHGFIDTDDLETLDPKNQLHASDLYRIIMDVDGVLAVRNLSMANAIDNVALTKGEKWCLELTPKYRPHFDLNRSQITFFKGVLPFTTDKTVVGQRYLEEKAANAKALLDPYQLDLPIPEGQHHDLEDYLSIMEDFPLTYGIGEIGLKGTPDAKRKGQARQLKGYLLFFDQLLANYLAQLGHIRELFSMRPDEERNGKTHTYFTHLLTEVPGIEELVKNFHECEGNNMDELPPEDFPSYLVHIAESIENYQERRNRFLDHLLARFSESFSDYVLLMFKINGKKLDGSKIIQDKADFLQSYPDISRNRGKAFNYSQPIDCNVSEDCGEEEVLETEENKQTNNVSGLEKRVSKLIGIDESGWQNMTHGNIRETDAGWGFSIKKDGEEVLNSKAAWASEEDACLALTNMLKHTGNENFYRRLTYNVAGDKVYAVTILDKNGSVIAVGQDRFPSLASHCEAIDEYFSILENAADENIELEVKEEGIYYVIRGEEENVILNFQAAVIDQAETDLEGFKSSVKNKKYYCRQEYTVPNNFEYGFILVDESEEIIAEGSDRFEDPDERDAIIHWLISKVMLPGMECKAVQETECYEFQLFDYTGEKILFQSKPGFQTPGDAREFFESPEDENDFMDWAVQKDNYEKTEKDGLHSFFLKNNDNKSVALHPQEYETEQECSDRMQAIIYYLDNVPPVTAVEGTPGTYKFEITDAAGSILFQSALTYPTQVEARSASWLARLLSHNRVYYHLLENPETDLPYSFELLDRSGDLIGIHPQWYATDCERDLAMDVIIYCSENLDVLHHTIEKKDGFYLEMSNPDGTALMNGLIAYPDADTAESYWENLMERAMHKDNFRPTKNEEAEYPFGYELLDTEGKAIASFALTYATEAESIMALRAILNYVCHTEWLVELTGDPGSYSFSVDSSEGRRLLDSVDIYPDEPSAKLALQNVLQLTQNTSNFYSLDNFGFEIRDEEGIKLASHPQIYTSETEQDAAIKLIVNYVRNDAPLIDILNIGGAFQAVFSGENEGVFFKGTTIHPNKKTALAELDQLFLLASSPYNYQASTEGSLRCRYGFQLTDDEGKEVARHPLHYASATERDVAMMFVFAWHTNGEILNYDLLSSDSKFSFALKDFSDKILLQGKYNYETIEKVDEIWGLVAAAACNQANFIINYDNAECLYTVELLVNDSILAIPPDAFSSRTAAKEWIDLIVLIFKKQAVQEDALGMECAYYFLQQYTWNDETNEGEEKTTGLKGVKHYPVPSLALRACHESALLLGNNDYFKAIESDEIWRLILTDENGEPNAYSTLEYEDETTATDDHDRIQASLESPTDLSCENAERISTTFHEDSFVCLVIDDDMVLLEGCTEETEESAWESCNTIHELCQNEERYSLITNEEECLFSFELTDNEGITIATHPVFYATAQERNEAIQHLIDLVNSEGMHLVENILLRPIRRSLEQSYIFELFSNEQKATLLQSTSHFTFENDAWVAYLSMWVSLWHYSQGDSNCVVKIDDLEGLCKFTFKIMVASEDGEYEGDFTQVLAMPIGSCPSAEDRDGLLESMVNIVKDMEEAPVEIPVLPSHLKAFVNPVLLKDEVEGCQLMAPVLDHLETREICPPEFSDPYSFRATVVLPYWPLNFQQPEFRAFIESTLRQETPAHIFLRICWVNTRQMKEFEEAYCHWLAKKKIGDDTCGASAAKNSLLKILCRLRSIYPAASLHDCSQPSEDSNRIVLNYSIIGSANTNSHGKQ